METDQQTTLRDDISSAFDAEIPDEQPPSPPTSPEAQDSQESPASLSTETPAQKAGRTAGRPRDEHGRLLPGKPQAAQPAAQTTVQPAPVKPSRPSSWKKEFEPHWETLDPALASYIHQRETEYARGVSTYKNEAENARALNEAIAPFVPELQKHGVDPTQWIRNLGTAHQRLALGSPQDKVQMGVQLIRDYGIDPQALFNAIANPQYQQAPQQQQQQMPDFDRIVEAKLTERETKGLLNKFLREVPEKYVHFEQVKDTMAGLLQAGLAQDYESAYEAALRHPRHADLFEQAQEQRRLAEETASKGQKQALANRARSNAVSVKSSTPAGQMATVSGAKSLRDMLSDSFESVAASRV